MGLNEALEGKTYPTVTFTVDDRRVHAFAAAVGHLGEGIPPTFVTAPEVAAGLANVIADPELGLDLSRVLHGEQEYEWVRPLRVAETVTAEASIERIRGRGSTWFLTLRTRVLDEAGATIAVGRSTLIVRDDG